MCNTIRIQKYLSERGLASRRHAAAIIEAGRVEINGKRVTEPGARINPDLDIVALDGRTLSSQLAEHCSILLNKPRGYTCSRNSEQGKTVYSLIPPELHRLHPIGRLDKSSEGLLLMTTDGDMVNLLTHPRFGQEKHYRVTVSGPVTEETLLQLGSRLVIDGYRIRPVAVKRLRESPERGRTVLEFVMTEGRNRQIRKMCEATGLRVHRLVRTATHGFSLVGLESGAWRRLSEGEVARLKDGDVCLSRTRQRSAAATTDVADP